MNIVRKCECMVNLNPRTNEIKQFFFTTKEVDWDECPCSPNSDRRLVPKLMGFDMRTDEEFPPSGSWWVDRVATNEERDRCFQWMKDTGIQFNPNTLEYNYGG